MVHRDVDETSAVVRDGVLPPTLSAPHPHPSWGAGGPRQRAAGRVLAGGGLPLRRPRALPPAVLLEPDPLVRPGAEDAVRRLGFEPGLAAARVVFVNLAGLGACPRPRPGVLAVGYVAGRPLTGAAHALHGCCAQVLELRMLRDGPAFTALLVPPGLEAERPTAREADVLALLLAGATDRRMAAALGVAPSTVRTHVRAVLRKAGAADRRELRRLDGRQGTDLALRSLLTESSVRSAGSPVAGGAASAPCDSSGLCGSVAEVRRDSARGPADACRG